MYMLERFDVLQLAAQGRGVFRRSANTAGQADSGTRARAATNQKGKPMAKRPSTPKHRAIVNAQQELLKWCPNVEGVSTEDLVYVCWACGYRSIHRSKDRLMTRCHIDPYCHNKEERPDNFILLCGVCHREQPDTLPKEALQYWLRTREPAAMRLEREYAPFSASLALLSDEVGGNVVRGIKRGHH
jgi:5-methylcytosine-specific restriction endonuclease McrA